VTQSTGGAASAATNTSTVQNSAQERGREDDDVHRIESEVTHPCCVAVACPSYKCCGRCRALVVLASGRSTAEPGSLMAQPC
jgi:hypothetical protein